MSAQLSLDGNLALLHRGIALLEGLSDRVYAEPIRTWAPVGAQFRHVIEHYQSFLGGISSGRVDYDARARSSTLESSRDAALAATRLCATGLTALSGAPDHALQIQMDTGAGPGAPNWHASSVGRELQFLCSHTVHHFALIKLLLEGSVVLDPDFGMAPSTVVHQRLVLR